MTTTPYFFAIFPSASVLGPGMVSAVLKKRWSSIWQKYCVRNISCVQITCAPALAACSTRRTWLRRFAAVSSEQAICVRATVTFRDPLFGAVRRRAAGRESAVREVFFFIGIINEIGAGMFAETADA